MSLSERRIREEFVKWQQTRYFDKVKIFSSIRTNVEQFMKELPLHLEYGESSSQDPDGYRDVIIRAASP